MADSEISFCQSAEAAVSDVPEVRVDIELFGRYLSGNFSRLIGEVEDVCGEGIFFGKDVQVDLLGWAYEYAALVEAFE